MSIEYGTFSSLLNNLTRQQYGPLDISSVFKSVEDLNYYLSEGHKTTGVSDYWRAITPYPYSGQIIALVNASDEVTTAVITNWNTEEEQYNISLLAQGQQSLDIYIEGYYFNGKFYTDTTYTVECEKNNQKIYIDLSTGNFYKYHGDLTGYKPWVDTASDTKAGLVKLYGTHGQNTDGTMTQKTITDGVNAIKFAIDTVADEDGDGEPENVLVLDLPWD